MRRILFFLLALMVLLLLPSCSDQGDDGIPPDHTEEEGFPTEAGEPFADAAGRRIPYKLLEIEGIKCRDTMVLRSRADLDLALAEQYITAEAHAELSKKNYYLYQVVVVTFSQGSLKSGTEGPDLAEVVEDPDGDLVAIFKIGIPEGEGVWLDMMSSTTATILIKKSDFDLSQCEDIFHPANVYIGEAKYSLPSTSAE